MQRLKTFFRWFRKTLREFRPDVVAVYTAATAWFIMLSFLPFMIMLLSLIRFVPFLQEESLLSNTNAIPAAFRELIRTVLQEIMYNSSSVTMPLGALGGIVSASTGFDSLIKGLNIIYKRVETRPIWKVRVMCVIYTMVFLLILLAVLTVIVFGKAIYGAMSHSINGFPSGLSRMIGWRFLFGVLILTVFFTLLYKIIPNRKTRWFSEIPGAVLAAGIWMLFSQVYSLYISNFSRFSVLYGSLTVMILLMIWLYACIYIMYIGAYINVLVQKIPIVASYLEK